VKPLWSLSVPSPAPVLSLARERGDLLVREESRLALLAAHNGRRQAEWKAPSLLSAACCADDGSAHAAGGRDGHVWFLAPDLTPRWQKSFPAAVTAVALDPHGLYLAVADGSGRVHLLDRLGRARWRQPVPRPLRHLAFIPEKALLVGTAEFGLVVCLDVTGRCLWRDSLVAHIGSLAVSGDGERIVLACYSDGLWCYAHDRAKPQRLPGIGTCALARLSYDGRALVVADLERRVLLSREGNEGREVFRGEAAVTGLALDALGEQVYVATAGGTVLAVDLREGAAPGG
jgi:hypothetical protein